MGGNTLYYQPQKWDANLLYRNSTIKPPRAHLFQAHLSRGLIETGGFIT